MENYVIYSKINFPYTAPPTCKEWTMNMGKQMDTDSSACSFPESSGNVESATYETESFNTLKVSKRQTWPNEQSAILVNSLNG